MKAVHPGLALTFHGAIDIVRGAELAPLADMIRGVFHAILHGEDFSLWSGLSPVHGGCLLVVAIETVVSFMADASHASSRHPAGD